MRILIRQVVIGLLIAALQWLVLGRLRIFGAYPDAVLLYVAWLGLRRGRRAGLMGGFLLGLLMDALYDTWGIFMFAKTVAGFIVGLFPASEREILLVLPRQAFIGGFVVALLHNGIVVTLLALQAGASNQHLLLALLLGSAVYTAVLATLSSYLKIR